MADQNRSAREAIREVRRIVGDILRSRGDIRQQVADIYSLLDQAEADLTPIGQTGQRGHARPHYIVERLQAGEMLTESRPGGAARPFRVPKNLYDAVTEIVAVAKEPLKFEELATALENSMAVAPGVHQLRALMRFWLTSEPPLVTRARSRYSPVSSAGFARDAKHAWDRLAKQKK